MKRLFCIQLALALLAGAARADDADSPAAELQSFKVPAGYEISLFASEADGIVKPVQMRWDAQGRLWVACIPSYPQPLPEQKADDRVIVLEDPAHTGKASRSTVFARGLSLPLGLELGHDGVYLTDGNDLIHLRDSHGGLSADQRTILLRGFFSGDSHQNINSHTWGPGGEMYFCQGLHAFSRVETPYGVERLEKAGVWRYRPRTGQLDPFLGSDRGPQNPWGVVFDDWGQPIMISGNGQGLFYLLPNLIRTDHFLDPKQIADTRGIKYCGVDIIGTSAMPDDVQGVMIAGSIMNNSVYWFQLTDDGAGFHARDLPPLVTSSSSAFRAVDVKIGPDGAIYIADWYNPIIGHYQASLHHPLRDHSHGRIWRITAKGRKATVQPDLAAMSIEQLCDQLKSPERYTRYHAKRLLADKPDAEVSAAIASWVSHLDAKDANYEHDLFEALGVLESHELVNAPLLEKLLSANDFRARAYAAHVIGHWQDRLPDALTLVRKAAADSSPRVRVAAIVSASYVKSPRAIEAAAVALDQPVDRFILEAFTQATAALKPFWAPALEAGQLAFDNAPARLAALCRADRSPDTLKVVHKLLADGKLAGEASEGAISVLAEVGDANELAALLSEPVVLRTPASLSAALKSMAVNYRLRKTKPAGDLAALLKPGIDSKDLDVRRAAITLAGLWKLESARPTIESSAQDPSAPAALAQAADSALADLGGATSADALARFAQNQNGSASARASAVIALSRLDVKKAATLAAAEIARPQSAGEIERLVTTLLTRAGGPDGLAHALSQQKPLPRDSAKLALRVLNAAGGEASQLRETLGAMLGSTGGKLAYDAKLVASLATEAQSSGDAAAGERVFRGSITNCQACHAIGGAGGRTGPDLAPVGAALPIDIVVESVLWPQRQIKEGFSAIMIQTKDGDVFQGYRISEDRSEYVLREPATGKPIHIPQSNIKAKKEVGSLMPDGLSDGLTHKELVDLIRFLSELGKPGAYRVSASPLVRVWESAPLTPGAQNPPTDASAWTPRFATTAGVMPLAEVAPTGSIWLRFHVDVARAGRFNLKWNDSAGLRILVDGTPTLEKTVALGVGPHSIAVLLDPTARKEGAVTCEIAPVDGGEVRLPANRD